MWNYIYTTLVHRKKIEYFPNIWDISKTEMMKKILIYLFYHIYETYNLI